MLMPGSLGSKVFISRYVLFSDFNFRKLRGTKLVRDRANFYNSSKPKSRKDSTSRGARIFKNTRDGSKKKPPYKKSKQLSLIKLGQIK